MSRRPVVLIAGPYMERFPALLGEAFPDLEVLVSEKQEAPEPLAARAEILLTVGHAATPEAMSRMPRLRWVQSIITGTDGLEAALRERPDVVLTSARGIHGPQMAEMALLHMLALTRDVRRLARDQDARRWQPFEPALLEGSTVGIVGIGVIGEAIARRCKAFGMTVVGISRTQRPVDGVDRFVRRSELTRAVREIDFLVLCVPLSDETERLIDAGVLEAMRPSAYLINLARGPIVDEAALVEALRRRSIAGAGLDVFETAPLPPESPLWEMENVFITPWMAGRSDRYAEQVMSIVEPNLRRYLADELHEIQNVVNR